MNGGMDAQDMAPLWKAYGLWVGWWTAVVLARNKNVVALVSESASSSLRVHVKV